jgi:hypothetical protein
MKIDGACHCGFLTYEAAVDPAKVEVCHCSDCQRLSGSAFRVVVPTEPGTFRLLTGIPKTYVKTAESGNRRIQAFCPHCGTSIYGAPFVEGQATKLQAVGLRVGTINQRAQLTPQAQFWTRSRMEWVPEIGKLPACETQ